MQTNIEQRQTRRTITDEDVAVGYIAYFAHFVDPDRLAREFQRELEQQYRHGHRLSFSEAIR